MVDQLATRAYYAVVRALAASNKLNFDSETLLLDLQNALGLDDGTVIDLTAQTEQDEEVNTLKQYDSSITKAPAAAPAANLPALQVQKPAARPTPQAYTQESPFSQPANKKQRKSAGGGSLPPPTNLGRTPSASPAVKSTPQSAPKQSKQRMASSTPQQLTPVASGALAQRNSKPAKLTISQATFQRVMQRNAPDEMETYLNELNAREREIFTQLIALGVDENDPTLNEVHKDLIRWYKLDQRQQQMSQQMAMA